MENEKQIKLKELNEQLTDLKEVFRKCKLDICKVQGQIDEIEVSIESPYIPQLNELKGKCIKYNTYDTLYNLAVVNDVKIYENVIVLMISGYKVIKGDYIWNLRNSISFEKKDNNRISEFLKDLVVLSKIDFMKLLHESFQIEFDRLFEYKD
jgi:hypothetical protein